MGAKLPAISKAWLERYGQSCATLAIGLFALALIYWRIVNGYQSVFSFVNWPEPPHWAQFLSSWKWGVITAQAVAGLILLYVEISNQVVSRWLRNNLESSSACAALIGTAACLLGSYLVQPGNVGAGDQSGHIAASWIVRESIKQGDWFVYWSTYSYFGCPLLQFHNSAYYYLVALVGFLKSDILDATEITLLALHVLSAFPMYSYTRQVTGSRVAGFVAALTWSATFYRYHVIIIHGKLPIALVMALWPLQLCFTEQLIESPRRKKIFWCALILTTGAMLWVHALYGGWAVAFGIIYGIIKLRIPWAKSNFRQRLICFGGVLSAHGVSLLLALYQIYPTLAEQHLVGIDSLTSGSFNLPVITLKDVVFFERSIGPDWFGGYVGNALLGIAVLSAVVIVVARCHRGYALAFHLGLALFMAFAPGYWPALFNLIFHNLPMGYLAYASKTPGLYLIAAIAPMSALTGVAAHLLSRFFEAKFQGNRLSQWIGQEFASERLGLLIGIVILAELVPLTLRINNKYPDSFNDGLPGRAPFISLLARSEDKTARIIDTEGSNSSAPYLTGFPGLYGFWEDLPKSNSAPSHLFNMVNRDAAVGALRPETSYLLYQLNISYVITNASVTRFHGLDEVARTGQAALWQTPGHTALVATPGQPEAGMIRVDDESILVNVISLSATNSAVEAKFSIPSRAFVQAAYAAYPYQKVLLDGKQAAVTPTALGLIGFWADAGEHTLTIAPELSPARKWSLGVSAITTLATLALLLAFSIRLRA